MADKKEKGADKKEKAPGKEAAKGEKSDSPDSAKKRSKGALFGGIALVLCAALGVGGFFGYKTFAAKAPLPITAGKEDPHGAPADAHGEAAKPADAHGEAAKPADAHGEAAKPADAHGEAAKPADAHGEAAKPADAHGEAAKPADAHGEAAADSKKKKKGSEFGKIFNIGKMDVNVGGGDLGRGFVRIAVAIEYEGEDDQKNELESRSPQIKDLVISTVGSRQKNDLLAKNGKEILRKDLLNSINRVAERPVRNVYFTEFLVE